MEPSTQSLSHSLAGKMSVLKNTTGYLLSLIIIISILFSSRAFAANKNWVGDISANWNTASNWSGDALPLSTDNVIIDPSFAGYTNSPLISVNSTFGFKKLTVQNGAVLTIQKNLTVTDDITVTGTNSRLDISAGTLSQSVAADIFVYAGGTINHSGGTITTLGMLDIQNSTYNLSGTGVLNVGTTLNVEAASANTLFNMTGGTASITTSITYTATNTISATITVSGGTFTNSGITTFDNSETDLTYLNVSGGTVTLTGTVADATGWIQINVSNTGSLIFQGALTMEATDVITQTGGTITFQGGNKTWTNAGTLNASAGTVVFNDATATVLTGAGTFNFFNLTINSSKTLTATAPTNINVAGNWTNSGGTFNEGTKRVTFNGTGAQAVTAETFYDLKMDKASGTLTLSANVTASNSLTMTQGNIDAATFKMILGTSTVNVGTLNYTAGAIIGKLERWIAATGTGIVFPVGTSGSYRPATATFTNLTSGSLIGQFIATDPGSSGLTLTEGGANVTNQFTEGYWDFTAANSLASTNYQMQLTGTGFTSYTIGNNTRIIKRTNSGSAWTLNGTHQYPSGSTANRTAMSGIATAQFGLGTTTCTAPTATVTQASTAEVAQATVNNVILKIVVRNNGLSCVETLTQFNFNTSGTPGSTNPSVDISNAKLYYTAATNTFSTSTLYGALGSAPNGAFSIAGSQLIDVDSAFFWLTYDIAGNATRANVVDGKLVSYVMGGTTESTITTPDPSGSREINAQRYSLLTGNWNSTATWSYTSGGAPGAPVPTSADYVFIENGHTITLNSSGMAAKNITITAGASASKLYITTGGVLTCDSISVNTTSNKSEVVVDQNGQLTVNGGVNIDYTNLTVNSTTSFAVGNTAQATISHSLNLINPSLKTLVVLLDGSSITTVGGNIILNGNTSGKVLFTMEGTARLNMASNFSIPSGKFGTLDNSDNSYTSIINFNGTSAQTLEMSPTVANSSGWEYGIVWINNTAGVTLNHDVVNGATYGFIGTSLIVQSGTLYSGGYNIQFPSATTSLFEVQNGATYYTTTTGTYSGIPYFGANAANGRITLGASSTVNFAAAAAQVIPGLSGANGSSYGNVIFSGGGRKNTLTAAHNATFSNSTGYLDINGNLTISNGDTLDVGTSNYPITIAGNWTDQSASSGAGFIRGTGTVTFDGTGTQTITLTVPQTFYNFTNSKGSGDIAITGTAVVANILAMSGGNFTMTGANKLRLGTATNSIGTLNYTSGNIIGKFERYLSNNATAYLFPVGTASSYRPATITFSNINPKGSLIVEFVPSDPGSSGLPLTDVGASVTNQFTEGYWDCTAANSLASNNYDMQLTATGFTSYTLESNSRVLKRTNSGSAWTAQGTHTFVSGVVASRTGLSGIATAQFGIGRSVCVAPTATITNSNTNYVAQNTTNNEILRIAVSTNGSNCIDNITQFNFSTVGTPGCTNAASDITNAKVYYTGTSSTFSTATLFGSLGSAPNGSFTINGSQQVTNDLIYFWLTYDIPTTATQNNVVDAKLVSFVEGVNTVSSGMTTPDPAGSRVIYGERYSVASGTWGATSTWAYTSGGAPGAPIPTSSDNAFIESGYTVTVSSAGRVAKNVAITGGALRSKLDITGGTLTCDSISMNTTNKFVELYVESGGTLTVNNGVNVDYTNVTENATQSFWVTGTSTATINRNLSLVNTTIKTLFVLLDGTSTTTVVGNITFNGTTSGKINLAMGGTAKLNLKGNFSIPGGKYGTLSNSDGLYTSIINFNGTSAQTLEMAPTAANSSGWQYAIVWINNTAGVTLNHDVAIATVYGNILTSLIVQSGTLNSGGYDIQLPSAATSLFEVQNGATYYTTTTGTYGGIAYFGANAGLGKITFGPTSTINFAATANQVIPGLTGTGGTAYGNVILSGTNNGKTLTAAHNAAFSNSTGAFDINGDLTVANGITLDVSNAGNYPITIAGNWTDQNAAAGNGFNKRAGTVTFDGTGSQTITPTASPLTFYNLIVNKSSGTLNIATSNIVASNALTMTQGNIDAGSNKLTLGTAANNAGTLNYTAGAFIGNFERWIASTGTGILFPVGTASTYRPATATFTNLTNGSLIGKFVASDPGSSGLPITEGGATVTNQFTEGYWDFTAANSLASTNYQMQLTATGFTSYTMDNNTRIIKRTNSGSAWAFNGTHQYPSGSIANRTAMTGIATAQLGLGTTSCSLPTVTVTHSNTTSVPQLSFNNEILKIAIYNGNCVKTLTQLNFNTTATPGSTNPSVDISNAKVYYTGTTNTFSTSTLFGALGSAPNGAFSISGSQSINVDSAFFWLTFDIPSSATRANVVDAKMVSYVLAGATQTNMTTPDPSGSRTIRADRYSIVTGNWNTTATWAYVSGGTPGASVPTSVNDVFIESGHTVTVNSSGMSAKNITVTAGGTASKLYITTGGVMTCDSISVNTTSKVSEVVIDQNGQLTVNNGVKIDYTNLTVNSSGSFWVGNTAQATINHNLDLINPSAKTLVVLLDGSSVTTIVGNITSNGTTSGKVLFNMAGTARLNFKGNFSIPVSKFGTLANSDGAYTSIINFNGTAAQTLEMTPTVANSSGWQYGIVWINNTAGVTLNNNVTNGAAYGSITTSLIVQSGTLYSGGFNINFPSAATSLFEVQNGATYYTTTTGTYGGIPYFGTNQNQGKITFGATSTINFAAAVNQVIPGLTGTVGSPYGNVILSGANNKTLTAAHQASFSNSTGAFDINGNLTIANGVTLDVTNTNYPITIAGNWTDQNTVAGNGFNGRAGTVTFDGTGTQTIALTAAQTFYNFTNSKASGDIAITGNAIVGNILAMSGGNFTMSGSNKLTLGTTVNSTGTLTYTSGTIIGKFERYIGATATAYVFPIGTASSYRPATATFTVLGTKGSLIAEFIASNPGSSGLPLTETGATISNQFTEGYWDFTGANSIASVNYQMQLTATGFTSYTLENNSRVLKRTNSGSAWTLQGTHTSVSGSVAGRTALSGISTAQFGIGTAACDAPTATITNSNTTYVPQGTTNNEILRIAVATHGTTCIDNMTQFNFSTVGTPGCTNAASDISNAKVYYTGTSSTFSTSTLFGSLGSAPNGNFTINGSQQLTNDLVYFWLTYDIASSATQNNVVDAKLVSFVEGANTVSSGMTTPDPAGSRTILGERYSVATGSWGATSTWAYVSGGAPGAPVPTTSDNVFIQSSYTVTLSAAGSTAKNVTITGGASRSKLDISGGALTCDSISMNTTSKYVELYVESGGTLTVNNGVNIDYTSVTENATKSFWVIGASTATINRNINLVNPTAFTLVVLLDGTSVTTVVGNITFTGTVSDKTNLGMGGTARLNIKGAFSIPASKYGKLYNSDALYTSIVNFNGTSAQTLELTPTAANSSMWQYSNVWINNTAGVTLNAAITIGPTYATIQRQLVVQSGTLNSGGFNINLPNAATSLFEVQNGATYYTTTTGTYGGMAYFGTNLALGKITLGATSTVNFAATANQVIPGLTGTGGSSYGNVIFSGSNTKTLTAAHNAAFSNSTGALDVNGDLTIANGVQLDVGNGNNYPITAAGNWTDQNAVSNAGFNKRSGTVTFDGTGSQTITATATPLTFYNLTVNKSAGTLSIATSNIVASNALTMTQGNIDAGSNKLTLGTATNNVGTLTYTAGAIIGNFERWIAATGTGILFPVGTSSSYRPATGTFTNLTSGSLIGKFVASNPGSSGLPLVESGASIGNQFTEGYWDFTAANSLASTNYRVDLTGTGFTSFGLTDNVRVLKRTNSGSSWALQGTHVALSGSTAARTTLNGIATAQFGFGHVSCTGQSAVVTQPTTTDVVQGSSNNEIIKIEVNSSSATCTDVISQFNFNTAGTPGCTAANTDLSNAKVYYTGTSGTFATTTLFGSLGSVPNGAFTINGSQTITNNTVYFWLTYDLSNTAVRNNLVDGKLTSFVMGGSTINGGSLTTPDPAGSRSIKTDRYAVASGNWNATSTWSYISGGSAGAAVPTANDNVYIPSGFTVTVNAAGAVAKYVTITAGASRSKLDITTSGDLSCDSVSINTTNKYAELYVENTGLLTVYHGVNIDYTSVTESATKSFWVGNTATAIIYGNLNLVNPTAFQLITQLDGTSSTTVAGNISFNGTSTNKALLQMAGTARLNIKGSLSIVGGKYGQLTNSDGLFTSIINFNGTSAQTMELTPSASNSSKWQYAIVWINNPAGVTLNASSGIGPTYATIQKSLYVKSGILKTGGYSITLLNSASSIFQVDDGATFYTTSTDAFGGMPSFGANQGTGDMVLSSGSTVNFAGASQVIPILSGAGGSNYGNVILSGSGTKTLGRPHHATFSGTGAWDVDGDLTVSNNIQLDVSINSYPIAIAGDWTDQNAVAGAGFNKRSGTVTFEETATQTITPTASPLTFYNFTVNKSIGTLNIATSDVTVSNVLTLTAGNINTSTRKLTLGTSTGSVGTYSRTSGTIIGKFERWINATSTNIIFPVGTNTYYRPDTVYFTNLTSGSLTCEFVASAPSTGGLPVTEGAYTVASLFSEGYWSCTAANSLASTNYKIMLSLNGFTSNNITRTTRVVKRANSGSNWAFSGTHINANASQASRSALSGFSEFGVGVITCTPAVSPTLTVTQQACNYSTNGAITLSISGGTSPYSYAWSHGATTQNLSGLSEGAYSVTITDVNYCTATASGSVGVQATVAVTHATNYDTPNGAVDLTVSGGTSPYTYLWNDKNNNYTTQDRTGLQNGWYKVTVTDNAGCKKVKSMEVAYMDTIHAGSYIVDMGVTPQTTGNGLKPYGFIYDMIRNYHVPVEWVINPDKALYGTDFSLNGVDYKGGPFVVESEFFDNTLDSRVAYWESQGMVGDYTTTDIVVPVYAIITGFSNLGIDQQSSGIVTPYFTNASVPSSLYYIGLPSVLGSCDNAYILPHADPTWTDHHYLRDFVNANGYVWLGCHAVSVFEGIYNPADNTQRMNFLSTTGMQCYSSGNCGSLITETHGNETAPYTYDATIGSHPLMQFMSDMTPAMTGGSEHWYIPLSTGGWNTGTYRAIKTSDGAPGREGIKLAFGNAYDNKDKGLVMYEASHSFNGTAPENISAQRAFFDFILHSSFDRRLLATSSVPANMAEGTSGAVSVTVTSGGAPFTYSWSSNVSGSFANATAASTTFTLNAGNGRPTARVSVVVTDGCGRIYFETKTIAVLYVGGSTVSDYNGYGISCKDGHDGYIRVSGQGGTPPYTYAWAHGPTSNYITGLPAGTYYVSITDAALAQVKDTITLTEPATAVSVSAVSTGTILCYGDLTGSIDLTPSGGVAPYNYLWSNSASTQDLSNLTTGTYIVTVTDANGCYASSSPPLSIGPDSILITPTVTNVDCYNAANGSISLSVSGGTGAYTYSWSTGASASTIAGLSPISYTVTVTDANACSKTAGPFTITQPAAALSASSTTVNILCFGNSTGSIDLTPANGTSPYTYLWTGGATTQDISSKAAGSYTVTITDANACTLTHSKTLTQPAALSASSTTVDIACFGNSTGSIDLTPANGTSPYTYSWTGGATTQDISSKAAGSYTVTITDANACTLTHSKTLTQPAAALSASSTTVGVLCFGNSTGSIDLTPANGTSPYTYLWTGGATTQDISSLAAGTYTVTVTDANGCTVTHSKTLTQPAAALSASSTSVDILCFGNSTGSIDLTPANGTSPYTYSWTGGATTQDISGKVAGTYTVTITDANSCTLSHSKTLTQPAAALSATTAAVHIICPGGNSGAVDLTPAGGTTPYTYSWTGGATTQDISGKAAGSYTVTITDANACTLTRTELLTASTADFSALAMTGADVSTFPTGTYAGGNYLTFPTGSETFTLKFNHSYLPTDYTLASKWAGNVRMTYTMNDANGSSNSTYYSSSRVTEYHDFNPGGLANQSGNIYHMFGRGILSLGGSSGGVNHSWTVTYDFGSLTNGYLPAGALLGFSDIDGTPETVLLSAVLASGGSTAWLAGSPYDYTTGTPTHGLPTYSAGPNTYYFDGPAVATMAIAYLTTENLTSITVNATAGTAGGFLIIKLGAPVTPSLTATSTQSNVTCFGGSNGSIDLTPVAGTSPYTYNWTGGATTQDISNKAAGAYIVTITDANACTVTHSKTLTQPTQINPSFDITNVTGCHGDATGSATINVSGGTGPYSAVSPFDSTDIGMGPQTFSNLPAISINIHVRDANNCRSSDVALNITEPSQISSSMTVSNVTVNSGADGSITQVVSGGTGPYSYSWSNGVITQDATNLIAGNYSVTITDAHGCTLSNSDTVTEPRTCPCTWLGFSNDWHTGTNWDCGFEPHSTCDVIIPAGTPNTCDVYNTDADCRSLTIQANATLNVTNSQILDIYGDFTNSGTFIRNNSIIRFKGAAEQQITGSKRTSFWQVQIINTSATGVRMHKSISIFNDLKLFDGYLFTETDTVKVENPNQGTLLVASPNSFVVGKIRRKINNIGGSGYEFPLGDAGAPNRYFRAYIRTNNLQGTNYVTGWFGPVVNHSDDQLLTAYISPPTNIANYYPDSIPHIIIQNGDTTTGVYTGSSGYTSTAYANNHYTLTQTIENDGIIYSTLAPEGIWHFEPDHQPHGGFYDLIISTVNLSGLTDNNFGVLKRPTGTDGRYWCGGMGAMKPFNGDGRKVSDGYAMRTMLTTFSEDGGGGGGGGGLPIELVSFDAKLIGDKVVLSWATETEVNNDYFTIEKSDGTNFKQIAIVPGAGNSSTTRYYSKIDTDPFKGVSYYRLKQTDFDKKFAYSDVVSVKYEPAVVQGDENEVSVYPNPSNGEFSLVLKKAADVVNLKLFDAKGNLLRSIKYSAPQDNFHYSVNIKGLPSGVYYLKVDTGDKNVCTKKVYLEGQN